ncbi:MAG: M28 family peptidase [Pseudomonadota bacterium]
MASRIQLVGPDAKVDVQHVLDHVHFMCHPEQQGRLAGSAGEQRTVDDLCARLERIPTPLAVTVEPLTVQVPLLDAMPRCCIDPLGRRHELALLQDFGVAVQGATAAGHVRGPTRWLGHELARVVPESARGHILVCWGQASSPLTTEASFEHYLAQLRTARDGGALALLRVLDRVEPRKLMLHRREVPGLPVLEILPSVARGLFENFPQVTPDTVGSVVELVVPLRVEERRSAGNVIAQVGEGPPRLIVCAHHDGLGSLPDGRIYPGAVDNACAVAILLEALRSLVDLSRHQDSWCAIFTAAEEPGLFGAEALARNHAGWWHRDPVVLVLDELGGHPGDPVLLLASEGLRQDLERVPPQRQGPDLQRGPLPALAFADHLPLLRRGLRRVGIATAPARGDDVIHTLRDTPDRVDAARLGELVHGLRALVRCVVSFDVTA